MFTGKFIRHIFMPMVVEQVKVVMLSSWQNFVVGKHHLAFSVDGIAIKYIEFAQLTHNARDDGMDSVDTRTIIERLPPGN